ncbi:MAG: lasso RiPP family leader peptide-containing protein [Actinomycetota bacterium]|nr:lasso RiPP family leader peptide-containing protein [Actinomycetota bacterium]
MKIRYEVPTLTVYGSVASLTMGQFGSDADGNSGMAGNQSDSDGMGPPHNRNDGKR